MCYFIAHMLGIMLAAGKGTRMKSARSKLLFEVNEEPLCFAPYRTLFHLCEKVLVVVGHKGPEVKERILERALEVFGAEESTSKTLFYTQEAQNGTGHAVKVALEGGAKNTGSYDYCVVLNGDLPLITEETLNSLVEKAKIQELDAACLSYHAANPQGLGRIERDSKGIFRKIVEEKDADSNQKQITDVNSGVYIFKLKVLEEHITKLTSDNSQNEIYLTDMLGAVAQPSLRTGAVVVDAEEDLLGVNNTYELSKIRKISQDRLKKALCVEHGVVFEDIDNCFISARCEFRGNAEVGMGCRIEGHSIIGDGVFLDGHVKVKNSEIHEKAQILWSSVLENAKVGAESKVGPMAHLRPGSDLGKKVKVGNFVEIKKTVMHDGSKASHLSYLGDADIGEESNIGAGTITCNYDGFNKFKTKIGKRAFVGSDSQLVAPVEVGDDAYVGSGTTVTEDVPNGALAISRPDMVIKEGYAQKLNAKRKAIKEKSQAK